MPFAPPHACKWRPWLQSIHVMKYFILRNEMQQINIIYRNTTICITLKLVIYVYLVVIITKRPKQRTLSWSKIPRWSQHGLLTKHPGPEAQLAVREIRIASVQVYFEHRWRQLRMCCASSAGIKNINQRLSYCRQTTWTVYLVYVINDVIKHFVDKMALIWLK